MAEPKRCEIRLLDDRKLEMLVQPKLLSGDLLDIVVSHCSLREKDYFGIWYLDDTSQKKWLRPEKKVLDHSFQKNMSPINLMFGVRLYVPSFTFLKESNTVELFYLQAIKSIIQGNLFCDYKTMFLLAAYVMQAKNGDYISESITYDDFSTVKLLPNNATDVTTVNGSLNEIVSHYKRMSGLPRGDAIINYLNIVERLPMYGIQFFNVKDKNDISWRLGVSHRGVGLYDLEETNDTKEIYTWNRIENLFYRDKKFSIEIRNLSRTGSNNSISSLGRYSTIRNRSGQKLDVVTWSLASSIDCREAWSISVGYHQLYVNSRSPQADDSRRTVKDIARELTRSTSSLALSSDSEVSQSSGYNHLPSEKELNLGVSGQLVSALKLRKQFLEKRLHERKKQLNKISLWESDLTNVFDVKDGFREDCYLDENGKDWRRFKLENEFDYKKYKLYNLKKDCDLQRQVTDAAKILSEDEKLYRTRSKEKQILHKNALAKLRLLNIQLDDLRNFITQKEEVFTAEDYMGNNQRKCPLKAGSDSDDLPIVYENQRKMSDLNAESSLIQGKQSDGIRKESITEPQYRKEPVKGKYLFGEFGNSGIYSSLKAANINKLSDCTPNLHGSASLTMISASNSGRIDKPNYRHCLSSEQRQYSSSSYGRLSSEAGIPYNEHSSRRTSESQPSRQAYSRSLKQNDSEFTSVLAGAAWSQLSQPSLETLAKGFFSGAPDTECQDITDREIGHITDGDDIGEGTLV